MKRSAFYAFFLPIIFFISTPSDAKSSFLSPGPPVPLSRQGFCTKKSVSGNTCFDWLDENKGNLNLGNQINCFKQSYSKGFLKFLIRYLANQIMCLQSHLFFMQRPTSSISAKKDRQQWGQEWPSHVNIFFPNICWCWCLCLKYSFLC